MDSSVHIILAIWILAASSIGFSEDFQNRPTASQMDEKVALGMQCARGVNERCLATQYQTNPVAYYVTMPFTNTTGWYLNQGMMQTLDSKAKALLPYYANPNTIYEGATNIIMLSVTGLWAQLEIGDHTNQFTGMPVIGTNPPTYGDYPWRIYQMDIEERYKVLNASVCVVINGSIGSFVSGRRGAAYLNAANSYNTTWLMAKQSAAVFANSETNYYTDGGQAYAGAGMNCVYGYLGGWEGDTNDYWASIFRSQFKIASFINTNLSLKENYFMGGLSVVGVSMSGSYLKGFGRFDWLYPSSFSTETNYFGNNDIQKIALLTNGIVWTMPQGILIGETDASFATSASGPTSRFHNCVSGYQITSSSGKSLLFFNFQYCTDE